MQVTSMIAAYNLLEARLRAAMHADTSTSIRADLIRKSAEQMDRIERRTPRDREEARELIAFFVDRAARETVMEIGQRDMSIALALMKAHGAAIPSDFPDISDVQEYGPDREGSVVRDQTIHEAVIRQVEGAVDRRVALDRELRYTACSAANARFHAAQPDALLSRHLGDVIGTFRFETRARSRIERCLSGDAQDYRYALAVPDQGLRLIRCRMDPVRGETGEVELAVLRMDDVTRDAASGNVDFG